MRQPDTLAEVEEELKVALDARKELGVELEDEVIESFLSRVQDTIDARVDARVSEVLRDVPTRRRLASPSSGRIAVVLGFITGSLFMGVPLADMAGSLVALVAVVTSSVLAAATLILPQGKARNELGPRPG